MGVDIPIGGSIAASGSQATGARSILVVDDDRRCGIVVARARPDSGKKGKDAAKKLVAEFDALPRPKKPPGRG